MPPSSFSAPPPPHPPDNYCTVPNEKFVLVHMPLGREFQSLIFLGKKLEKTNHDCR